MVVSDLLRVYILASRSRHEVEGKSFDVRAVSLVELDTCERLGVIAPLEVKQLGSNRRVRRVNREHLCIGGEICEGGLRCLVELGRYEEVKDLL